MVGKKNMERDQANGVQPPHISTTYRVTIKRTSWRHMEIIVPASDPQDACTICCAHARKQGFRLPLTAFRAERTPQYDDAPRDGSYYVGYRDGATRTGCLAFKNTSNVRD